MCCLKGLEVGCVTVSSVAWGPLHSGLLDRSLKVAQKELIEPFLQGLKIFKAWVSGPEVILLDYAWCMFIF